MRFSTFVAAVLLTLTATVPPAAQSQDLDFSRSGLSAESVAAIQMELAELSKLTPPAEQPMKPAEFEKPASLGGAVFSPFSASATPNAPERSTVEPVPSGGTPALSLTAVTVLAAAVALTWLLRRS